MQYQADSRELYGKGNWDTKIYFGSGYSEGERLRKSRENSNRDTLSERIQIEQRRRYFGGLEISDI